MALRDKPNQKPVFDWSRKEVQAHYQIETKPENCQYLFNAGLAPPIVRIGNLSVEAVNAQIKMYVYE